MTLISNEKVFIIYCFLYVIKFLKIGTYFGLNLRMYRETFGDNQSTDGYNNYILVIIKNQHPLESFWLQQIILNETKNLRITKYSLNHASMRIKL